MKRVLSDHPGRGDRPRVLYVAVQNRSYPRNARIREYLQREFAAEITVLDLTSDPGYLRHVCELLREGLSRKMGNYDAVFLAELSLVFAPVSWILARRHRAAHIVDFFIGMHETQVEDRAIVKRRSLKALIYRSVDRFARSSANVILADTEVRARRWSTSRASAINLPVGAPSWAVPGQRRQAEQVTRILYYGNYIPLHGVPDLLQAVHTLEGRIPFVLTMVGTGDDRPAAQKLVREMDLNNRVTFVDHVPEADLAGLISANDIVIGIFGTSAKASSVIPNKVWQGLACGRVVITRSTAGVRELASTVPGQLVFAASNSPADIAEALEIAVANRTREFPDTVHALDEYVDEKFAKFGDAFREILFSVNHKAR